jgi:hypothetical protein
VYLAVDVMLGTDTNGISALVKSFFEEIGHERFFIFFRLSNAEFWV